MRAHQFRYIFIGIILTVVLFKGSLYAQTNNENSIYFKNNTSFTVSIATIILPPGETALKYSEKFIKIKPGKTVLLGKTSEEYFYYYAYCKNKKTTYTWQGEEEYSSIKGFGQFGCKKTYISEGKKEGDSQVIYHLNIDQSFQIINQ